jgi:predicted Fe-S protein YdhL (DUF1289 family)
MAGVMPPPRPIRTPCIQVCAMDPQSGLCFGCRRTISEIAGWARLTDAERERIMAELPGRATGVAAEKLGPR